MAKAKKVKKVKAPTLPDTSGEVSVSAGGLYADIGTIEAEISAIMLAEVIPRRSKILEYRRKLMNTNSECSCENLKKLGGSNNVQCQNPDCGKIHRLRGRCF